MPGVADRIGQGDEAAERVPVDDRLADTHCVAEISDGVGTQLEAPGAG
jgi:hypothetical protein